MGRRFVCLIQTKPFTIQSLSFPQTASCSAYPVLIVFPELRLVFELFNVIPLVTVFLLNSNPSLIDSHRFRSSSFTRYKVVPF